jgi:hypothetical protein
MLRTFGAKSMAISRPWDFPGLNSRIADRSIRHPATQLALDRLIIIPSFAVSLFL